jgi:hypothetical protein
MNITDERAKPCRDPAAQCREPQSQWRPLAIARADRLIAPAPATRNPRGGALDAPTPPRCGSSSIGCSAPAGRGQPRQRTPSRQCGLESAPWTRRRGRWGQMWQMGANGRCFGLASVPSHATSHAQPGGRPNGPWYAHCMRTHPCPPSRAQAKSKPMMQIIGRLKQYGEFEVGSIGRTGG